MTAPAGVSTTVPYRLTRLGVVMASDPAYPFEAEGVLNPASARSADGRLWLLPRLVAAGNVSRVGLAEVVVRDGCPVGVRRAGVALSPDASWERSSQHAGVEDPRATWMPSLGLHVMAYVAFGPLGPRPAVAVSPDLQRWRRLGPVHFAYEPDLDCDLNLCPNKDVVYFPDPVPGPDGRPAYAMLHRPMWDLGLVVGGSQVVLPAGVDDPRPGIWISYSPVERVRDDLSELVHVRSHRLLALPQYPYESLKIGAGPPPVRVPEGWLLLHHGVSGQLTEGWGPQRNVRYCAGAMLLDPDEPGKVLARTCEPVLEPELAAETDGAVANVVFPTAIEQIDGRRVVFYGMADSRIGVATVDHVRAERVANVPPLTRTR